MKTQIEEIKKTEDQAKMFQKISELATEISKTDESLLSVDKQWVNYGTWKSSCFANRFHFGEELANSLISNLSKKITHDEDKEFDISEFMEEIEESIYQVL